MSWPRSPNLRTLARKTRFGNGLPLSRERGDVDSGYTAFKGTMALKDTIQL